MNRFTCTVCGEVFETVANRANFCPACRRARKIQQIYESRKRHKLHKPKTNKGGPLMMADIRRRRVPVEAGWRGRPAIGGANYNRYPQPIHI